MNYVIIEQQTTSGSTAIVTPVTYDNLIQAEAAFLQKASYARLSGLDCHSVALLDQEGKVIARKSFS
jgi:hypothetical protein